MDGTPPLPRLLGPRLLAIAAAVVATMLLATSTARAADDATDPSVRWPMDGPAARTALAIAEDHWGMVPCQGQVTLAWEDLDPSLDAQSVWANDAGQYADPLRNTECEISFNPRGQWDWPKLCTVMTHEVGHLDGHDHVDDLYDVMYFSYVRPLPECLATPEPDASAPVPAPPPATPGPSGRPAATPASASRAATSRRPSQASVPRAKHARGATRHPAARRPAARPRHRARRRASAHPG